MAVPDVTVEVAFASEPLAASPTWTDVTDYVELQDTIQVVRGRSDEFDQVQPGAVTLSFNNEDGRFSPGNTSGAYYPNVIDGKLIRVRAVWDSVTYDRFVGFVDRWPVEWENGAVGRAISQTTGTDRFKRLSTTGELLSALEHEVLKDSPEFYYTLGEDSDSGAAGNTAVTDRPPAVKKVLGSGSIEFGSGTGPGTDELSAAVWDAPHDDSDVPVHTPANAAWLYAPIEPTIQFDATTNGMTYECWARFWTGGTLTNYRLMNAFDRSRMGASILVEQAGATFGGASFGVDSNSNLYTFVRGDGQTGASITYTGVDYVDDRMHHFVATYAPNTTNVQVRLYVDGVEVHTGTYGDASTVAICDTLHIGEDAFAADGDGFLGTMSHVALYTEALSAARIMEHYTAGSTAYEGEPAGERVARIAEYGDVDIAQTDLEDGSSLFGKMRYRGTDAVQALQEVAETENGVVFVDRSGDLAFHGRAHRYNESPVLTLNAEDDVLGEDTMFEYDDAYTKNDIYITQEAGPALRRKDQASIDARGRYREDIELQTWNREETIDAAVYRLNAYGAPRPRISQFTLRPHEVPTLFPSLLALEIGDMIRVENLPANAPVTALDLWVEGYTETIGVDTWAFQITTSPVLEGQEVWRLGVSGESTLNSTAVMGYGTVSPAIDADEVPSPRTWVDSDDYPSAALFNTEIRDMIRRIIEPPSIKLARLSDQSVLDGTGTWVEWDFAEVKNAILHSSNVDERPDEIQVTIPGTYLIATRVEYAAEAGALSGRRDLSIWINLSPSQAAQENMTQPAAGVPSRLSLTTTYELNAGDYVRVRTYQTSGETLTLNAGFCDFSMKWIGGLS